MFWNRRWGISRPWPGRLIAGPRCGSPTRALLRLVLLLTVSNGGWRGARAQAPAAGKPPTVLEATALADLRFGTVVPGILATVPPDAPRGAGLFEIRGERHMSVYVELVLPTEMQSSAGDRFPLSFAPGDGLASTNRGRRTGVPFDPHQPLIATLGPNGRLYVRLGGAAAPARLQVSGAYQATIILTVANLGN